MRRGKLTRPFADYRPYLLKAIRICHSSQTLLGERSGLGRQKIHYLLNRGKKISYDEARAIERATDYQVKWFQLAHDLNPEWKQQLMEESQSMVKMSLSEKVELGMRYEADLRNKSVGEVKGRIETIAAGLVQFGNYQTYRQAKRVRSEGIPELIQAMDLKKFKIYTLARIARYEPEEQRYLLTLNRRQIHLWIEQHPLNSPINPAEDSSFPEMIGVLPDIALRNKKGRSGLLKMIQDVLLDQALAEVEQLSGLPLRLGLIGMLCQADVTGRCYKNHDWEDLARCLFRDVNHEQSAIAHLLKLGKVRR